MGTHMKLLSENFPMNTNTIGFRWFSKIFTYCGLDASSLSIGRVKRYHTFMLYIHLEVEWWLVIIIFGLKCTI